MGDLCSVSLTGTLTGDPDYRGAPDGRAVCRLPIAYTRRVRREGRWEERQNHVDLIAYGALGSICAERAVRGGRVAATGELRWREVRGPGGKGYQRHEVVVAEVEFLSPPPAAEENGSARSAREEEMVTSPGTLTTAEDDIPF
jgi:single stranded DNA-binding protein